MNRQNFHETHQFQCKINYRNSMVISMRFEHSHIKCFCCLLSKFMLSLNHSIRFTAQMPAAYQKNRIKPRGVSNRNRGLAWIRANATEGVFYFADDDNTYDLDIFEEVSFPFNIAAFMCFSPRLKFVYKQLID